MTLRAALEFLLAHPHGCPMCDSGVLRQSAAQAGKTHWPECSYVLARAALANPDACCDGRCTGHSAGDPVRCAAKAQSPEPADCDWPFCGCDLKALNVAEHLREAGWMTPKEAAAMAAALKAATDARDDYAMCPRCDGKVPI